MQAQKPESCCALHYATTDAGHNLVDLMYIHTYLQGNHYTVIYCVCVHFSPISVTLSCCCHCCGGSKGKSSLFHDAE